MPLLPDYYSLLGIFRDATQPEIKRAYFEAAQRLHPDKNQAPGETEIFLDIQQAYDTLASPEKRAIYDASLTPEAESFTPIVQRVSYSRQSLVRLNETQLLYALLEWKPRQTENEVNSPPLNICLVLDQSTSMKGEKIDMAKAAAIHLIHNLREGDFFSVVTFSDRAQVLISSATKLDRWKMETQIRTILPTGATEIFQGLKAGVNEVRKKLSQRHVNHVILLTDGKTYGDEQDALALAEKAAEQGIGISGLGIGKDWNDEFLDALAAKTGSSSRYIAAPQEIQDFLEEKFMQLANVFAEKVELQFSSTSNINLTYVFRIEPNEAHLPAESSIPLGVILRDQPLRLLLELQVKPAATLQDEVPLLAGVLKFSLPSQASPIPPLRVFLARDVAEKADLTPPSPTLINALINLNLYRMQEKAQEEVLEGKHVEASRRLQYLATHLLSQGERSIAKTVLLEAEHLQQSQNFSEEGRKNIKYGTRALLLSAVRGKEL